MSVFEDDLHRLLIDGYWRRAYEGYKPSPMAAHIPRTSEHFVDDCSGAHFKSSLKDIKRAFDCINGEIRKHGSAPLNMLYDELDMPTVPDGDKRRWRHPIVPLFKPQHGKRTVRVAFSEDPTIDEGWVAVQNLKYLEKSEGGSWPFG